MGSNKLIIGVNDLQSKFPKIAEEWDYERNYPLTPDKVAYGSGKKVFWKCSKGHSWEAMINKRTSMKSGCPYCSHRRVLKGFNDLESNFPDIAKEWNYERNGKLTPDMVMSQSNLKVWWKCKYGHEWRTSIQDRTRNGTGCPYCAGQKVISGINDLESLFPDIAKEWDYEQNGLLKPNQVMCHSSLVVGWMCSLGHKYKSRIADRTHGNGCPYCSGKKVLKGFNDLESLRPDLIKQWDFSKNGDLKPDMVTLYSNKRVFWVCENGHRWSTKINSRTTFNTGCPICAKERMVSFPEKIIAYYLKKILPIRENIFIDKWNVDIIYDNIVIEYDGEYFHSKSVEKDNLKNKDLSELGFIVIRILGRDKSGYVKKSDFRYEIQESNYDHFKQLISDLCTYLKVSCPDVDVERDREKIKELLD